MESTLGYPTPIAEPFKPFWSRGPPLFSLPQTWANTSINFEAAGALTESGFQTAATGSHSLSFQQRAIAGHQQAHRDSAVKQRYLRCYAVHLNAIQHNVRASAPPDLEGLTQKSAR
jgi:hypothetical protein